MDKNRIIEKIFPFFSVVNIVISYQHDNNSNNNNDDDNNNNGL